MLAGEQEIRYVNIRDHRHFDSVSMPGERMHGLAISMQRTKGKQKPKPEDANLIIYWTNPNKGALSFRQIPYTALEIAKRNSNRGKRDVKSDFPFANSTLVPDGTQPRGIALDYLHGNLYWTDSDQRIIGVMNVKSEGREYRSLISWNLDRPFAVAVAPEAGYVHPDF